MRRAQTNGGSAGPRRRAAAVVAVLVAGSVWCGCSVEKHYELLSFFFDGVPGPGGAAAAGGGPRRAFGAPAGPPVSAHTAFVERRCSECHGDTGEFGFVTTGFSRLDATVCGQCHGDVKRGPPYLHGPVAADACLWCHEPHESRYPLLLSDASPDVCLQCHRFQFEQGTRSPAHEDLSRDCLECHYGHGGGDPYFLKPPETGPPAPPEAAPDGEPAEDEEGAAREPVSAAASGAGPEWFGHAR